MAVPEQAGAEGLFHPWTGDSPAVLFSSFSLAQAAGTAVDGHSGVVLCPPVQVTGASSSSLRCVSACAAWQWKCYFRHPFLWILPIVVALFIVARGTKQCCCGKGMGWEVRRAIPDPTDLLLRMDPLWGDEILGQVIRGEVRSALFQTEHKIVCYFIKLNLWWHELVLWLLSLLLFS